MNFESVGLHTVTSIFDFEFRFLVFLVPVSCSLFLYDALRDDFKPFLHPIRDSCIQFHIRICVCYFR